MSCWGLRSRRVYGSWPTGHYPACEHAAEVDCVVPSLCATLLARQERGTDLPLVSSRGQRRNSAEERFRAGMSELAAMAQTMSGALSTIALRESLQAMATVDELTGVWNRRAFETEAERAVARHQRNGEPFVMAILDIDHFKQVNDDFGHDAGDRALRSVADALQVPGVRLGDFVGRLGGEEFGIFLTGLEPGGDRAALIAFADRTIRSTCSVGDRSVTASIGFVCSGVDGLLYQDLFKRADVALYRAKAQGRDRARELRGPRRLRGVFGGTEREFLSAHQRRRFVGKATAGRTVDQACELAMQTLLAGTRDQSSKSGRAPRLAITSGGPPNMASSAEH